MLKLKWGSPNRTALTWDEQNPINYVYSTPPSIEKLKRSLRSEKQ